MFARYGALDGSPQYMHPPSCSVPGAYAPTAASQGGGGPEWWLIAIALQDEVALGCRRRRSNKSSNGGLRRSGPWSPQGSGGGPRVVGDFIR
jgi:hypothetical protein